MLRIVTSLAQLPFSDLMEVYVEDNLEKGDRFQAEQEFYQYLRQGFFTQPEDRYCLWYADGQLVSALRLQAYQDGLLLEALETAPAHRRKGHGEALVREMLKIVSGQKVYVHIADWNKPSILLHEKCGFSCILDHAIYADGLVTNRASTYVHNG